MLVIGLNETDLLLNMPDCLNVLEQAYHDLGNGKAINIPRQDMITPVGDKIHGFKTMSGSLPREEVVALRLNSDVVHWPEISGQLRRVKIPAAPGNQWVGLVMLFSTITGEPLAIMPDGIIQRMRVGGTGGLGIKYMAKPDSSVMALLGSGWQAGSAAMAACAVRPIRQIRVYSPNEENRTRFAKEMSQFLNIDVISVNSPGQACRGADIVSCATSAVSKVVDAEWLEPGMHFVCVKKTEIDEEIFRRADRIVIHTNHGAPEHFIIGNPQDYPGLKHWFKASKEKNKQTFPELQELITGRVKGRDNDQEITVFSNNLGLGFQFAAVGKYVYDLAKQKGMGKELPVEWFLQNVHP